MLTKLGVIRYIRCFAVRNSARNTQGAWGMDQDMTDIKKLEGEKRLLEPS